MQVLLPRQTEVVEEEAQVEYLSPQHEMVKMEYLVLSLDLLLLTQVEVEVVTVAPAEQVAQVAVELVAIQEQDQVLQ
jgi:hypothetical protein